MKTIVAVAAFFLLACTPAKTDAVVEHLSRGAAAPPVASPVFEVHFSPDGGCEAATIRHIDAAKTQILVQAYSFTSVPITDALIRAHQRGVDVNLILDKSDETGKGSTIEKLRAAGITVEVDHKHAIAHSKVMIYDHALTQTGSFNFTHAAEHSNAENCLFVADAGLSSQYETNWNAHLAHSH